MAGNNPATLVDKAIADSKRIVPSKRLKDDSECYQTPHRSPRVTTQSYQKHQFREAALHWK